MRDAMEILREFNELLESEEKDFLKALDLINEMKETEPCYIELMMNCLYEDDEDEEEEE